MTVYILSFLVAFSTDDGSESESTLILLIRALILGMVAVVGDHVWTLLREKKL
jgi:hypothetical protein